MESRFLIDYLTVSSKIHSPQGLIELFNLESLPFEVCSGGSGYRDGFRYDGIMVSYNGVGDNDEKNCCIELSGQGCRNFETHGHKDYDRIFQEYFANPEDMNITRLDVAFDDRDNLIDFQRLCWDTIATDDYGRPSNFVSNFRKHEVCFGVPANVEGNTIYWGSKKSSFFIRVYDKAKERGYTNEHWIRFELQMRKPYAVNFLKSGKSLRDGLLGVLCEYIRYVDDPGGDSNMRRWPMKPYWSEFLGDAQAVKLFDKPGVEYNMMNLENFVFKQAGNASAAWIEMRGINDFEEKLRHRATQQNLKYKTLIDQYGRKYKE